MRVFVAGLVVVVTAPAALVAQRGATGPIADLNAQAAALHETDPAGSLAAAQKALAAAREARDVRGEAEALNYVAFAYRNQSLLDLARQHGLESVRLFVEAGDPYGEAQGYNTLGLIAADDGKFAEALEHHLKALAIREKTGDREGLSYTYNNLGNTFRNMNQFARALEHHRQGLALKIELGNRHSEAYSHHNMGLVYFAMKDYANARAAYERGMAIREELNDPRGIAVSLNAIGSVEALTNPRAALATYSRALALRRQAGDERGEMATEINLGDVHRKLKDRSQARAALNRALAIGARIDAPLMKSTALKALSEVEAESGDYRAALAHQLEYQQVRDAMFNLENSERFQRLQLAHEAERRERQIELLKQQAATQDAELARVRTMRTALAVVAILVMICFGLLYARLRYRKQSEQQFRTQAEKLTDALHRVQTLKGLLPICASCKKIRDDNGYWTQVEKYVQAHSAAEFTHSICPTCFDHLYPEAEEPAPRQAQPQKA